MAQQAGIGIEVQVPRVYDQPRITDVGRLHQILGNLVRNAILHSGGRHLTIGYQERFDGKTLQGVWTIEDDGDGIPNPLIPGLFDPFNRLSSGVYSKSDGMGMGMYIVKLFAENLDGSVDYDRGGLGGARFTLTLPLRAGAPQRPAPEPAADYSPLTAALVEDNQMVGEITQRLLLKVFGGVDHLTSAETLLDRWQDLAPDVVITDIQLAEMDGRELIRTLRRQGFEGPVFVLSGTPLSDQERAAIGADAVLSKPLNLDELKMRLGDARERADTAAL
nr:ATP-binding protein [Thalassovita mangrovi]